MDADTNAYTQSQAYKNKKYVPKNQNPMGDQQQQYQPKNSQKKPAAHGNYVPKQQNPLNQKAMAPNNIQNKGKQIGNKNFVRKGNNPQNPQWQQNDRSKGYKKPNNQMKGMAGVDQFFPHIQNIQQMDQTEIQELVTNIFGMFGPEIAQQLQDNRGGQGQFGQNQNLIKQLANLTMGQQQNFNQQGYNNQKMKFMPKSKDGMPIPNQFPMPQPIGQGLDNSVLMQMPPFVPGQQTEDSGLIKEGEGEGSSTQQIMFQQQALITANMCQKHFPEPIIYVNQNNPMCKKCIPEYFEEMRKSQGVKDDKNKNILAQQLGIPQSQNQYQAESNQISMCQMKLSDFDKGFKYLERDIDRKVAQSDQNIALLPEKLCQTFDDSEKTIRKQKENFLDEIDNVIKNQLQSFQNDNEVKVPEFYNRLSTKYNELQMATRDSEKMQKKDLVEILSYYYKIFIKLDAEFEQQFNSYENVSKLERLFDKEEDTVVREFDQLIETNLRMDYNVKNSFLPDVKRRIHSFQWNQKFAYFYNVNSEQFTKRPVSMEFDVPLYSRSIATENGQIYLIGGCIMRKKEYLKKCYRFDEIFSELEEKAQMIYPHAYHSVCAIESFIYVVGSFLNNQVHGLCEVYDTKRNQWKQIDSLRIARFGVALSSFKNNYIFAFGGRVDQKNIVDSVECYDISKNVWQEIQTGPAFDKSQWVPGYMSLAYQITDNEIIIFGGHSGLTQQVFNGVFVFDVEKLTITERGKLMNPCSFMNTPLVFDGNMYAFGNDTYIHKYCIAEQKWECVLKQFL